MTCRFDRANSIVCVDSDWFQLKMGAHPFSTSPASQALQDSQAWIEKTPVVSGIKTARTSRESNSIFVVGSSKRFFFLRSISWRVLALYR